MKKMEHYVNTYGLSVLTALTGLLLLLNPDGAAALMTKLIGWLLVIAGAVRLIVPARNHRKIAASAWIINGLVILVGVVLLSRPMLLADGIGHFFGILLVMEGFRSLRTGGLRLLTVLTIGAGVVLIFMPRTLTHTLLGVCGIILIASGVIGFLAKRGEIRRLAENNDPNIIDADQ